ncbi:DUF4307 domain-containing protein [Brevibacterium sp. UMB10442]|mgnify:FL=1|uniref:DUF4307 domain-containing protein n=1 Tax=Brevibacterium sp. UMB1308A TaxID=3050608 RepID=UPI00254D38E9|nr:DUF4307 domain-containing protein [Brevibacterium sp. UMB1308A]MDK7748855.1 DUF4307 domain-containing protein [Brevibacterium sp. UMB10442]MDK8345776.1 DUF4307 domain-containing protein [Brevibacterium sp. UMB1308B]MDK8712772.1 DUF4307 domain-containing protein [Brevibacterium sp. UMB1308A]
MESLDSRYGRQGVNRRPLLLALTCVVVILIAGAAFLAFKPRTHPHAPQTSHFTAHDAANASVTFSIVPDPQRDIRCAAVIRNQFEAVVGYKEVTIPADPQATSASMHHDSVDIRTTQKGAQGNVESCAYVG